MLLVVTTPIQSTSANEVAAMASASRRGLPFVARGRGSLAALVEREGASAALVLSPGRCEFVLEGIVHLWSPGMGALRAKRFAGANPLDSRDPFLEAAGLLPGDTLVDCTVGIGADLLVAAVAVGPEGRAIGLEQSQALAAWAGEGFLRLAHLAAPRVEIIHAEHGAWLDAARDKSADVVVFDPMFRHARHEPPGFDLVRALADCRPLLAKSLARARQVARRWVLVKDGAPGWDLARLNLTPLPSTRCAHRYYARVAAA